MKFDFAVDWKTLIGGLLITVLGPILVAMWDSWINDWTITPLEWQYIAKMVVPTLGAWFWKSPFAPIKPSEQTPVIKDEGKR